MKRCRYKPAPVVIGTGNAATIAFTSSCSCGWIADAPQRNEDARHDEWEKHVLEQ